ncbi:MAG: MFS transporter [Eubacterium sp.]|nr:MFS transporter [Eubacterium sp.]MDE6156231.1 MFS transporter [Eubacterium sp.]
MSEKVLTQPGSQDKKFVKPAEFIAYLVAVFFYTNMTGMVGSYRNAYLVDVLQINEDQASLFNVLISIIPFVLNFFIAMYIDGRSVGKKGKFRPLVLLAAVPAGVLLVLSFWVPKGLTGTILMIYLVTIAVGWAIATNFGNQINSMAAVLTPNLKERDTIMSFRGIVSAVGNSAPLVIVLVIAIFVKDASTQYIIGAALCGVVGILTMLIGIKMTRERIAYDNEKKNPLEGFADIIKNKYAWAIIASEFLKSFRNIATFMGVFLAAALLGSSSKFLLFGLPTGIGTAVGMLVINFLLKKFNSKVLYIASGIYSVIINTAAFAVGYIYFKNGGAALQIIFIVFLFLIGLQFGASNLLPTMFQADVLEDIELKTGKRLDASLPFVIGIGTMISGTIASGLAPKILYGANSICGYVQGMEDGTGQSFETKVWMLFFYTIFHGLMMFLAGVPFFFYKLTGKTKEDIHNAVIEKRKAYDSADSE